MIRKIVVDLSQICLLICLVSCGGGGSSGDGTPATPGTFSISGSITGLTGTVVLQNNASDNLSRAANGVFTFATPVSSAYAVTVLTQPAGQVCIVSNGNGTLAGANINNVSIACSDPSLDPGPALGNRPLNATCLAVPRPTSVGAKTFVPAFASPNLLPTTDRLTGFKQIPGNNGFWYVADRAGVILRFAATANVSTSTTALDIRNLIDSSVLPGEGGLLGFAFSPDFATNGAVYVSYMTLGRSRISRFISSNVGSTFNPREQIIFEHVKQNNYHNAGDLHFDANGYLYLSLGDDGQENLAQDRSDFRGKILRIDPRGDDNLPTDAEILVREYAIPPGNPFINTPGARPEIYAYGLRNPWRFTIDRVTGDIWVGDVGAGAREEVDLVIPGGNYGWPLKEGTFCPNPAACGNASLNLIDPVVEYGRTEGLSVIGGHVYRGTAIPELTRELTGKLIFSEWSTGTVWALSIDPLTGNATRVELGQVGTFNVVSWGQGNDGEIYAATGGFPRLSPGAGVPGQAFPQKLSETGCVLANDVTRKPPGVIPYAVNVPLWSDDAAKKRWLAIPNNQTITISGNGHWDLPVGSVLIKEFIADGRLAETRLMMRHTDGGWAGYPYKWNAQGTDADLVLAGSNFNTGSRNWAIPSAAQCFQCHTVVSGQTLGMETAQMNRSYVYQGAGDVNQLSAFDQLGLLSAPPANPATLPALSPIGSNASVEKHARDYLHVQCAHCHQLPGPVSQGIDLRWSTAFAGTGLCDVLPTSGNLGVPSARRIKPGVAAESVLSLRMHATNSYRMPRVGTILVDQQAMTLVDTWINALLGCPP